MQRHHFSSFVEFTTKRLDVIRNLTVIQQEAFKEFQDQFQQLYNNAGQNQQRLIIPVLFLKFTQRTYVTYYGFIYCQFCKFLQ